ncbi:hypothetical protein KRR55_06070 [Paeniglutamicibacter sp. ABSL32-1]|uniref:hypothetical protein n=1 Tax=Paeniglutamicibacter quisquiliarum TaxID=2849498 RepID=UPI001C2D985E|nr:hypothetical protein [Paeniglutamicibacter quisquiliarum]MBV1778678.1 hypothetical protein [Paeniglutamicibacter quisquiliarum]
MADYQDNVQRVLNLMKSTFGSEFTTYYDGEPEVIPLFNLPCIIVTQTSDTTAEAAMGQDDIEDTITVKVVLNKKDDWNGDKVDPLNMTERKIRDYIGKRDEKTGNYEPRTVKGALRKDLLEDVEAVAPTMNVEYGINPRAVGEDSETQYANLTAEGHVTFGVQFSVDTY